MGRTFQTLQNLGKHDRGGKISWLDEPKAERRVLILRTLAPPDQKIGKKEALKKAKGILDSLGCWANWESLGFPLPYGKQKTP